VAIKSAAIDDWRQEAVNVAQNRRGAQQRLG